MMRKRRLKKVALLNKILISLVILFFVGLYVNQFYDESTYFSKCISFVKDIKDFFNWLFY